jgi:hypothetical protein
MVSKVHIHEPLFVCLPVAGGRFSSLFIIFNEGRIRFTLQLIIHHSLYKSALRYERTVRGQWVMAKNKRLACKNIKNLS